MKIAQIIKDNQLQSLFIEGNFGIEKKAYGPIKMKTSNDGSSICSWEPFVSSLSIN